MDVDDDPNTQPPSVTNNDSIEEELDQKYPNRPRNHSPTLPFHKLFEDLFNPLDANRQPKTTKKIVNRRTLGPNVQSSSPQEARRAIIERFISRWRQEVGDDFYPAFRLIVPDKDRERAMYGLKEKVLGRFLVKIMQIDKNSEDGYALLNWKLPGQNTASRMAGDFAGRCFEVISKRPLLVEPGDLTITEVNDLLDQLSGAPREENQLPILKYFYQRMNAEELMWLIRIILRQMKIGATERTFFDVFHPDAESLFNVSSSLRRVCWDLHSPSVRLENEDRTINLMQCFQPQLAQFQMHSFTKIIEKMGRTEDDQEFWIEEKLDGERMQLHMITDSDHPGSKRFRFWSRKAKDYTYLYGDGFEDDNSSLTRFLRPAFREGVENIILDGEMITWDPEGDVMLPFGTLKTAALAEQRNPFAGTARPLYRVFDILYLNDQPLTRYTLRDRRKALERSVSTVHRRLELHEYTVGSKPSDIEPPLREVVAQASEGLVIKNPRSAYRLNERNDDWMKVKPEYMIEFGESLDCLIIGGFYGSGKRGGALSSYLCGLRVDQSFATKETKWHEQLFWSFFKVGGGLTANDYATIRHHTDGKWIDVDAKKNDWREYLELGGPNGLSEKPDVWIKPEDSVVVEVKAAQVAQSEDYKMGKTLRFPRFKKLRTDKDWRSALSIQEMMDLQIRVEQERKEKEFEVDEGRRKRRKVDTKKKQIHVSGYGVRDLNALPKIEPQKSNCFDGLTFYIMTESTVPERKSKIELEEMVKANGGKVIQTAHHKTVEHIVCIAERETVKVASLRKTAKTNIFRPLWLFDSIKQSQADFARGLTDLPLPLEQGRHVFYAVPDEKKFFDGNVDSYGDSYARDTTVDELRQLMQEMVKVEVVRPDPNVNRIVETMQGSGAWIFRGLNLFFDGVEQTTTNSATTNTRPDPVHGIKPNNRLIEMSRHQAPIAALTLTARFAGATIAVDMADQEITHIIVQDNNENVKQLRKTISTRKRVPRMVTKAWIEECWKEKTLIDEDRFRP